MLFLEVSSEEGSGAGLCPWWGQAAGALWSLWGWLVKSMKQQDMTRFAFGETSIADDFMEAEFQSRENPGVKVQGKKTWISVA